MSSEKINYINPHLRFKDAVPEGTTGWQSPSNIALIKYWGKRAVQLPMNPSVSFTLSKSATTTTVRYKPATKKESAVTFYFEDERNRVFEQKTIAFFKNLHSVFPFLSQMDFEIRSENSFPHSAGIASSASGMSALALILCDLERTFFGTLETEEKFLQKASYIARLGSGSACRSVYGGIALWGKTDRLQGSSDEYVVPVQKVHPLFHSYRDYILIVDPHEKKVSSRAGHELMKTNPFAPARFKQANQNLAILLKALETGDTDTFIDITELEALTLHAMMMTSQPSYMLMKPATVAIMEKIRDFRNQTGIPVAFTLDAGPNIHMLFPEENETNIKDFMQSELNTFVNPDNLIADRVGKGPQKTE